MTWLICHRCGAECSPEFPFACSAGCPPCASVPMSELLTIPGRPAAPGLRCLDCDRPRAPERLRCERHLVYGERRRTKRAAAARIAAAACLALLLLPRVSLAQSDPVEAAILRAEAAAARAESAAEDAEIDALIAEAAAEKAEAIAAKVAEQWARRSAMGAAMATAGAHVVIEIPVVAEAPPLALGLFAAVGDTPTPALDALQPLSDEDAGRCSRLALDVPVTAVEAARSTCAVAGRYHADQVGALVDALNRAAVVADDRDAAESLAADPVSACWLNRSLRVIRDAQAWAEVRATMESCFDGIDEGEMQREAEEGRTI